jgi:hypothetical protein
METKLRLPTSIVPSHVGYALTPLGQTLCEPTAMIRTWVVSHMSEVLAARQTYEHRRLAAAPPPRPAEELELRHSSQARAHPMCGLSMGYLSGSNPVG